MKNTALNEMHEAMGGRMIPFAGYYMPVEFEGIQVEHRIVREKLGVFDVSHMGEFLVEGPKAKDFIQKISTNDVNDLYDGKVQYSCMTNDKGGIVDDFLVYRFKDDEYLLVVNAANIDKDWDWCKKQAEAFDLKIGEELKNISDDISQLAVQGPYALKAMQKLTDEPIEDMTFYTYKVLEFAGVKDVLLSTTGYTGAGGCEIYFPNDSKHIEFRLKWFKKQAVRQPEAIWYTFKPWIDNAHWRMHKTGLWLDPLEVVPGGNRRMHALDEGLHIESAEKKCRIIPLDAPLAVFGNRHLLNFSRDLPDLAEGVHFNLYNNVWGTNFRMWFEEDMVFRFECWFG
ncbi:MAG: hypothetical protein ACOCXO_04335 [Bacteroidota bacterium]